MIKIPKRWFRKVADDLSVLPDAIEYYLSELDEAQAHSNISGGLMRANQDQPGLIAFYDAMHTDLDAILGLMDRNLRIAKAVAMKEFLNNGATNKKAGTTELKMLIEGEPAVMEANEMVDEVRHIYKQYSSVMAGLTARGYSLNNISKLRAAGLEEVEV